MPELNWIDTYTPNQGILTNAIVLKEGQASSEVEDIVTTHENFTKP